MNAYDLQEGDVFRHASLEGLKEGFRQVVEVIARGDDPRDIGYDYWRPEHAAAMGVQFHGDPTPPGYIDMWAVDATGERYRIQMHGEVHVQIADMSLAEANAV